MCKMYRNVTKYFNILILTTSSSSFRKFFRLIGFIWTNTYLSFQVSLYPSEKVPNDPGL